MRRAPIGRPGTRAILVAAAVVLVLGVASLVGLSSPVARIAGMVLVCGAWAVTAFSAIRQRDKAAQAKQAYRQEAKKRHDDRQESRKAISAKLAASRAEQARQAKRQERALSRLENELRQLYVTTDRTTPRGRARHETDVLFVTSNGAGLGHVTRLLAIAEHLPEGYRYELLTLSKAYEQVRAAGLTVHYFPSSDATQESPQRWNRVFRSHFRQLVSECRPRAVVFDGTWVYSGLTDVCRANDIPLIWVQRGLWKEEIDKATNQRHDAINVVDEVIVPGDYAGFEEVDAGRRIVPSYVGPIVRTGRFELLTRDEACQKLGLDPAGMYALVNVGSRAVGGEASEGPDIFGLLKELHPEITPVQVVSPLAPKGTVAPDAKQVKVYPVMPLVRAFEFTVSAAGYNSAQEAVALAVPTIFVPNLSTTTDDQARRARQLAEKGLALTAGTVVELRAALEKIGDPDFRESLKSALHREGEPEGAAEAAAIVDRVVTRSDWPLGATTIQG